MILPKKQLSIYESYFGFGAFLLGAIKEPILVDDLWKYYKDAYDKNIYPVLFGYDQFLLALDYLYIIGSICITENGLINRETSKIICK